MTYPDLFHFTCDHGAAAIGRVGWLRPAWDLAEPIQKDGWLHDWWPARWVWLTTLSAPDRAALGLTMHRITCDRTRHRYRVLDPGACYRWSMMRGHYVGSSALADLEGGAADPGSWWVARSPVRARLDPIEVTP